MNMKPIAVTVAALLTACSTQAIQTLSVPQAALEARPLPVLEGLSNRAVGIYAVECKAALDARERDIEVIRKAVGQ